MSPRDYGEGQKGPELDKNLFPKHQRPNFAPQVFGLYLYYCNAGSDNHPFYNGIEIKVEHLT